MGGTQRVIDAVTAATVPHLVHMSSVGAYSPKQDDAPIDESWPTGGVPTSMYSRHKTAAERLLDRLETDAPEVVMTQMRPGIVGQRNGPLAGAPAAIGGALAGPLHPTRTRQQPPATVTRASLRP